jgi:2-amino-4-hydroxy-6-hydroxymethyldihydropteridine diphosphokinase
MARVFLGLGSNIGDKQQHIRKAISLISELGTLHKISHLYLTEPVGGIKQEWFLNCAVEIETSLHPEKLLSLVKSIERKLGRKKTVKNGPRSIDIDILFYGDFLVNTKNLVIPHPLIQERRFVLQPLMDLDPFFIHPVLKNTIQELYQSCPWAEKVQRYK